MPCALPRYSVMGGATVCATPIIPNNTVTANDSNPILLALERISGDSQSSGVSISFISSGYGVQLEQNAIRLRSRQVAIRRRVKSVGLDDCYAGRDSAAR